jgi:hypothetical protein
MSSVFGWWLFGADFLVRRVSLQNVGLMKLASNMEVEYQHLFHIDQTDIYFTPKTSFNQRRYREDFEQF